VWLSPQAPLDKRATTPLKIDSVEMNGRKQDVILNDDAPRHPLPDETPCRFL
jgi:hypothetical protein